MTEEIELLINGKSYPVKIDIDELLVDVIRDKVGLYGTKKGCETGDCGACTILLNGIPVTSCLVLAISAVGKSIETIEGISNQKDLHPLQKSFIKQGAIQCGYCTPGILITTKALLEKNASPTESEIKESIAGNLCRCTGYTKIVDAIKDVVEGNI